MLRLCFLGFLLGVPLAAVMEAPPHCEPLKPQRARFQSRNFRNILHWHPGRSCTSNSSSYTVQYKIYGEKSWTSKASCSGIQQLSCDLTDETSLIEESYYGRVRMSATGTFSGWAVTPRFIPWWETKLDSPSMNVTQGNRSLLVHLSAPPLPGRAPRENGVELEKYYDLVYRVFITNEPLENEQMVYEGPGRLVEIEALTPPWSFCVEAEMYQSTFNRGSQRSEKRCVGMS